MNTHTHAPIPFATDSGLREIRELCRVHAWSTVRHEAAHFAVEQLGELPGGATDENVRAVLSDLEAFARARWSEININGRDPEGLVSYARTLLADLDDAIPPLHG